MKTGVLGGQASSRWSEGTDLDGLAPSKAFEHLLKSLPVDRVRVVKVELASERELELMSVMPLVERVLRENDDVGDVVEGREDLFGDRRLGECVRERIFGSAVPVSDEYLETLAERTVALAG
jgi:hypothetical protein